MVLKKLPETQPGSVCSPSAGAGEPVPGLKEEGQGWGRGCISGQRHLWESIDINTGLGTNSSPARPLPRHTSVQAWETRRLA